MSEELVSALLDGECSATEVRKLLDDAGRSPELAVKWGRMSLVREVLAGTAVARGTEQQMEDFCSGVMSRLGTMEPVATAFPTPVMAIPSKVVSMPNRKKSTQVRRRRSRPLIGWAAAASFTLIAVAGGRAWLLNGDNAVPAASLAAASSSSTRPVSDIGSDVSGTRGGLMAVSTTAGRNQTVAATEEPVEMRWTQLDPDTARELSDYMLEHNNSRADQGMNGALGYARLATHNVDYQSSNEPH